VWQSVIRSKYSIEFVFLYDAEVAHVRYVKRNAQMSLGGFRLSS